MAPSLTPVKIRSAPGIKRDGTRLEGSNYVDGVWCRFQRGLPRKMGGYRAVTSTIAEKIYGMHLASINGTQYAHLGAAASLTQVLIDAAGSFGGQNDRTPAAFASSVNNVWQFDVLFDDTGSGANKIIAHAGQNLATIDSTTETPIYFGDLNGTGALIASAMPVQSGGIVVLAPFLFTFGNAGRISVSAEADPATFLELANPTGSKIVRGLPLRGNGQGPSGLFWSLDSLIRATFDPTLTPLPFAFDTITAQSSILSSRSVIEYDGNFYWLGVDRPLMFTGVVQVIPNMQNLNWFYDNLNRTQAQKVFVYKVPRFGEIWWCFPFGSATECTHALVYNVNEKYWYDTILPTSTQAGAGRSDGIFPQVYSRPLMMDLALTASGPGYTLWQHETGTDSINGSNIQPIRSSFLTHELSFLEMEKAVNRSMRVALLEPDFVQSGNLSLTVTGRDNARAPDVVSTPYIIADTAATPEEQTVPLKEVRRLMSFKFESNTVGGDYQLGDTFAHIGDSDGRTRS